MSEQNPKGHNVLIATAVIGLVGTVSVGLLNNWDKLFPQEAIVLDDARRLVESLTLGDAVAPDNTVRNPTYTFKPTDTIFASVVTDLEEQLPLIAIWAYQDGQVVAKDAIDPKIGHAVTQFSISKPDGWPIGTYTLTISLNNATVLTREFYVKK